MNRIQEVLDKHTDRLMGLPGVFGLAIGGSDQTPVIEIHTDHITDVLRRNAPLTLDGIPVQIREIGRPELS